MRFSSQTFTRFLSVKYRVSLTPSANALLLAFMSEKKLHVLPGYLASHIIIRVVDTEDPVYVASHGTGEEASRRCGAVFRTQRDALTSIALPFAFFISCFLPSFIFN